MKYILNISKEVLVIRGMTVGIGQDQKQPIVNKEMLEWPEIKDLLAQHKIEIMEGN